MVCAICLESVSDHSLNTIITKCDHTFHTNCLEKWIEKDNSCPVCRNNPLFAFILNISIFNTEVCIEHQLDDSIVSGKRIYELVYSYFPHLSNETNLDLIHCSSGISGQKNYKCSYWPLDREMHFDVQVLDPYIQMGVVRSQYIKLLSFEEYDKLRVLYFPYSFIYNEKEKKIIQVSNKTHDGVIIKETPMGYLFYSREPVRCSYFEFRRFVFLVRDSEKLLMMSPDYECLKLDIDAYMVPDKAIEELLSRDSNESKIKYNMKISCNNYKFV